MDAVETNPTILVVDDSVDIHRILRARLSKESLDIVSATGGAEGLELSRNIGPSLILLDLDMPGMDGFEVLRLLKDETQTSDIPVIVLSGSHDSQDKVMGLDLGAVDYVCKPFDFYELIARVRCALRTQRLLEMLAKRAQIDGLTGLWNRAHFDLRFAEYLSGAQRYQQPLTLAMCDVDKFKSINDNHGHPAGDAVLQGVAEQFVRELRKSDVAFRFGGEEFAIILPKTTVRDASVVIDRLRLALAARHWPRHPERRITASFGLTQRGVDGSWDPAAWIEAADRALYAAKEGGRNRICGSSEEGETVRLAG